MTQPTDQDCCAEPEIDRARLRLSRVSQVALFTLQVLPVAAYGAVCLVSILREKVLYFGRLDVLLLLVTLGYLCAVILAGRRRRHVLGLLVLTYSALAAVLAFEIVMLHRYPLPTVRVPWPPIHRVSQASDTMPGVTGAIEFTTNNLGLRGSHVNLDDTDLSILCVGGSTTICEYVTDELTWPWLTQARLSHRQGRRVFVGNGGRPGHFSLHHEHLLEHYSVAPRFGCVVLLCGINDSVLPLLDEGQAQHRTDGVPTGTLTVPFPPNRAYYHMLALFRCLSQWTRQHLSQAVLQDRTGAWYATVRARRRAMLQSASPPEPSLERIETAVAAYRATLSRIIRLCRDRGQRLVMMTQPTMWRRNLPKELDDLLWQHTPRAFPTEFLARHIERYNRAMVQVCKQEGIDCIDLASMLPKDTSVFYDDCHFNVSGCERVAKILCDFVAANVASAGTDGEHGRLPMRR